MNSDKSDVVSPVPSDDLQEAPPELPPMPKQDILTDSEMRAWGQQCYEAGRQEAAIKMDMALTCLRSMSESGGLIPGAAEGFRHAVLVIEPMFREFLPPSAYRKG